jgi:hypothetical protein
MKVYRVDGVRDEYFAPTLKDAHNKAKYFVACACGWQDVRIEEVEVRDDKAGVIAALNRAPKFEHTGRVWEFKSQRLGLEETTGLE